MDKQMKTKTEQYGFNWRRFEYRDGTSSKFWEILVTDNKFEVRYGRIGTAGQNQTKEFDDAVKARKQAEKLISEKTSKGYVEVSTVELPAPPSVNDRADSAHELGAPTQNERTLNPDACYHQDIETLLQFANSLEDDNLKIAVKTYADQSRPYCIPKFMPFDRGNPQHRFDDQIFCGFPFTSAKWPWPKEKSGAYMQPIAQINLKNAGKLLECDLGDGLLQVWGEVSGNGNMDTRVIRADDLNEPMDNFYPETAPWLDQNLSFEGCVVKPMELEEENVKPFCPECCRVEWMRSGRMFYGTVSMCILEQAHDLYERIENDGLNNELESLDDLPERLAIPGSNNLEGVFGVKPLVHLGGYQEDYGNVWESYGDPRHLLFYFPQNGWECIGVTFEYQIDKEIEFVAVTASSY